MNFVLTKKTDIIHKSFFLVPKILFAGFILIYGLLISEFKLLIQHSMKDTLHDFPQYWQIQKGQKKDLMPNFSIIKCIPFNNTSSIPCCLVIMYFE